MRLAIVGGGQMGEAILRGALARGFVTASEVAVAEILPARRAYLAEQYGVGTCEGAAEAMVDADLVLLAVKPQDAATVGGAVPPGAVLVSIMAGVTVATIRAALGHEAIVRVMPNTPAAIGEGISAWTATEAVSPSQRDAVRGLLAAIGPEVYLDSEAKVDMATAVSGSGPAYVFLVAEAMIEGAVAVGLPRAYAEKLVLQTIAGSGRYAQEAGKSAADLRAQVTSPAGTTAAGLLELERAGVRAAFVEAIRAAHRRAIELGTG